jgi:hypothetical protein
VILEMISSAEQHSFPLNALSSLYVPLFYFSSFPLVSDSMLGLAGTIQLA